MDGLLSGGIGLDAETLLRLAEPEPTAGDIIDPLRRMRKASLSITKDDERVAAPVGIGRLGVTQ